MHPPRELTFVEGSLEVKLPTMWTGGRAEVGRVREEKEREKKEDAGARKGRKVAIHSVFPKAGSLKRRVRSQLAR